VQTYSFKLYRTPKEKYLWRQLEIANEVWNFCITAIEWNYRETKKHLTYVDLGKIITQVKKAPMYAHWKTLNSQAIEDQAKRIHLAWKRFFANLKLPKNERQKVSPPRYKKRSDQKSWTLRQNGIILIQTNNKVRIGGKWFKYHKSREIEGKTLTLTVKRNKLGEWFIFITSDHKDQIAAAKTRTGKSVGFDFGLKQFLTGSDGSVFTMPLYFKRLLRDLTKANRNVSRCKRGSKNRKRALRHLNRMNQRVANARADFHWKLALQLVKTYEVICLETLNLEGMKKLWGRKVSDLGFYGFVQKLKYQAEKHGTTLVFIDPFFPSSKQCSSCKHKKDDLNLRDREWDCSNCSAHHNRDANASRNILEEGMKIFAAQCSGTVGTSTVAGVSRKPRRKAGKETLIARSLDLH
jgi:putative transposase